MKRLIYFFALFILVSFVAPTQSFSQDDDSLGISVTPRIWFTIANLNAFEPANEELFETMDMTVFGATFTYKPKNFFLDFMLTFLGGSGKAKYASTGGDGTYTSDRFDFEALVRYRVKETNLSLFGGIRYISYDVVIDRTGAPFAATGTDEWKTEVGIFLLEGGVGMFTPITDDGRHQLFANFTGGLGNFDTEAVNVVDAAVKAEADKSKLVAALDTNFGYSFVINKMGSVHTRYRFFAITVPNQDSNDMLVIHGPEIGATIRF